MAERKHFSGDADASGAAVSRVLGAVARETATNKRIRAASAQIADHSGVAARYVRKQHPKYHIDKGDEEEQQKSAAYQQALLDRAVSASACGSADEIASLLSKDGDDAGRSGGRRQGDGQ